MKCPVTFINYPFKFNVSYLELIRNRTFLCALYDHKIEHLMDRGQMYFKTEEDLNVAKLLF